MTTGRDKCCRDKATTALPPISMGLWHESPGHEDSFHVQKPEHHVQILFTPIMFVVTKSELGHYLFCHDETQNKCRITNMFACLRVSHRKLLGFWMIQTRVCCKNILSQ